MMTERINLEKELTWHTDIEYAYSDLGIDKATVYRAGVDSKNKYYEITVYPLALIDENANGWDYRIVTVTKGCKVIDEYDAGAEHYTHFASSEEAKKAGIKTLKEMLEEH